MRNILALVTIATIGASVHPTATTLIMSRAQRAQGFAPPLVASQNVENVWNGRWQGATVSGQPLVLQLQVQGQRMTGRLTVGKQSANIIEGKVVDDAFALTTGPIDGHKVLGTGRILGDAIELTIEGVKEPLSLTRVK
jgi:hypothetical protein